MITLIARHDKTDLEIRYRLHSDVESGTMIKVHALLPISFLQNTERIFLLLILNIPISYDIYPMKWSILNTPVLFISHGFFWFAFPPFHTIYFIQNAG
jgi:hypothetical protein